MKLTNIEINNTNYNNISDLFTALVSLTINDSLVIDGISATYSDDCPAKNNVTYPDGFRFKSDEEQAQINEQVFSSLARHARQHEKKQLHDAIKKFMSCKKVKKF